MADTPDRLTPKLAVILHADIVGSTSLVQIDERVAHERIQDAFKRLSQFVLRYGGTVHEIRGDALLAEFGRTSDALGAALGFQSDNIEFNSRIDDDIAPRIRIGISMGEVVIADGTLTGPEVVLAQRLEQLASADGVCVSDNVRQSTPARLPIAFDDAGLHELKGFENSFQVYNARLEEGAELPAPAAKGAALENRHVRAWIPVLAAACLFAVIAGAWLYQIGTDFEPVQPQNLKYPLPEKPSIAVLPFTNLDPLADDNAIGYGITSSIISVLSSSPDIFVISQNSTRRYKGTDASPAEVAQAFGVRYVLEGTVQQNGDMLRVTTQLSDTSTGRNIWSGKFDVSLQNLFEVQDEVTRAVVENLLVKLTIGTQVRSWVELTGGFESYLEVMRGRLEFQKFSAQGHAEAARIWGDLLKKHDDLVYEMFIGWIHWQRVELGISENPQQDLEEAIRLGKIAVERHPECADCYVMLGTVALKLGQYDAAVEYADRALRLAPGAADVNSLAGSIKTTSGFPDEGIALLRRGMRYEPDYPHWIPEMLTHALIMTSRLDEARAVAEGVLAAESENVTAHPKSLLQLAVIAHLEDDEALAAQYIDRHQKLAPDQGIDHVRNDITYFKDGEYADRFLQALRSAGLR